MTIEQYLETVTKAVLSPYYRRGQHAFNVLYDMRPDLSEKIRSTPLDPFHSKEIPNDFLQWVKENW